MEWGRWMQRRVGWMVCVLLLMLIAGCNLPAAKYVDVSDDPRYQKLMSTRWTTEVELLFLGIDAYPSEKRIEDFKLVPHPGFDGPEVLSRSLLPSGTQVTVIGARRCTNCGGDLVELLVTIDGVPKEQPIYFSAGFLNLLAPRVSSGTQVNGITLRRVIDAHAINRDQKVCSEWDYAPERFAADLGSMRRVDAQEWYRACYQYACSYQGEVELQGRTSRAEVSAGGWISLTHGGQTQYFVSDHKRPGFLAGCNCCE
jgi:hypothetical protein